MSLSGCESVVDLCPDLFFIEKENCSALKSLCVVFIMFDCWVTKTKLFCKKESLKKGMFYSCKKPSRTTSSLCKTKLFNKRIYYMKQRKSTSLCNKCS